MAHYLWKPSAWLQNAIKNRLPTSMLGLPQQQASTDIHATSEPFIGFHIRLTDNSKDLESHFARNATITRSFDTFMNIAESIRLQNPPIQTIYVATDNSDIAQECQNEQSIWTKEKGWKYILQRGVKRSTQTQRMWFRNDRVHSAAAIATDIEVLRKADYLVGSFQSNVYRLATQLNTAYHVDTYSIHKERHFTVDLEWYEDP